jgi:prepilin-type N-terminal cleavage/methylation domain-containing protein
MKYYKRGFTLIELSITLIIIGLIIGGILRGQSLTHYAQMRSIISQVSGYNAALATFNDKFKALPGDFNQASVYISNTQNGNGDGLIGQIRGSLLPQGGSVGWAGTVLGNYKENRNMWHHLESESLITGSITSSAVQSPINCSGGNLPPLSSQTVSNSCILLYGNNSASANFYYLSANYDIGILSTVGYGFGFSPIDAQTIDSKLDDGMPYTGIVLARSDVESEATYSGAVALSSSRNTGCVIGTNYATSSGYNVAVPISSPQCSLQINLGS